MDLSPRYHVCTKAIIISKGSYGYGETRNVFRYSVQKSLLPVRAVKAIGHLTETCVNWGGLITMVRSLHQENVYIQRKLRVWRDQKCISFVGAKTPLTCAGRQTTLSQRSWYRPENGNLHILGWTCRHGAVFAPRQYLYQKEATGMERPEMYCISRSTNPSYLCGPSNYPISRELVWAQEPKLA